VRRPAGSADPARALLHGLRLAPTTRVFDLESRERDSRDRVLKSALCGTHETPFSQGGRPDL
jgi:hypothetical protein